jgi:hypothetical protein
VIKTIVILAISFTLLSLFFVAKKRDKDDLTKIEHRTDLEPLKNHFPVLSDITAAYWKSGRYGNSGIGLSDIWLKGFVILSGSKCDAIQSEYTWNEAEVSFDKGIAPDKEIVPDITGLSNFRWYSSEGFTKLMNGNEFMGDFYLDKNNQVLYFDLSTY